MRKNHLIGMKLIISFNKYLRSTYYYFLFMIHGSVFVANALALKKRVGQSVLEYFLLFTVIIVFTVIGVSTFFPNVRASFNSIQNAAIERIIHAGNN